MLNDESENASWFIKEENNDSKKTALYCPLCRKLMKTEYCFCSVKKHLKCQLCEKQFSNLSEFRFHIKCHQEVSTISQNFSAERTESERTNFHKKIIEDGTKSLLELVDTKNRNDCSLIKIMIGEKKRTQSTPSKEIGKSCVKCGESFNNKLSLIAHSLCHSGKELENKEYRCDRCDRDFPSASRLSIHISCMHITNKKYKCCVCRKGFSTTSTLEAHKRLHLGIKPYKCDECGKAYSQSGNLAYHKSTHSGIKSFICHLCGKAFLTAGILSNHERRHSGLKPFVCDICGRAFSDNYSLSSHKIVHTGVRSYMCDCCGKAFVHKHTLASHKRIHSGEKKYKCPICERAFTQLSTMLQHKNTHTGEKAYTCLCGKSFTQQSSLARHKRLHDGIVDSFPCQFCDKKFGYKSTLYKHHRKSHGVHKLDAFYTKNNIITDYNTSMPL